MKRHKNMFEMKEQEKTPRKRMRQTGDKQSTRKRIYNNGYKDAQWPQEKNR